MRSDDVREENADMKWEYRTITDNVYWSGGNGIYSHEKVWLSEAELVKLGNDRWELVGVATLAVQGTTHEIQYTFKRPKP